jgi:hypothetical protein
LSDATRKQTIREFPTLSKLGQSVVQVRFSTSPVAGLVKFPTQVVMPLTVGSLHLKRKRQQQWSHLQYAQGVTLVQSRGREEKYVAGGVVRRLEISV